MTLANCSVCKEVFDSKNSRSMCPACQAKENDELLKVSDYIRKNPSANIIEVSGKTGVSQSLLFKFVRNGAISIKGQGNNKKTPSK
jgi:hypothetical protein